MRLYTLYTHITRMYTYVMHIMYTTYIYYENQVSYQFTNLWVLLPFLIYVFENERKQYDSFRSHSLGLSHLDIKSKVLHKLLLKITKVEGFFL